MLFSALHRRTLTLSLALTAGICVLVAGTQAHAVLYASDNFDTYAPGSNLIGASDGSGWDTAWAGAASPASTVEALNLNPGSGNAAQVVNGTTASIDSILSRGLNDISGSPVYVSLLVQVANFNTGSDFVMFQLTDGAIGNAGQALGFGVLNAAGNPFFARSGSSAGATDPASTLAVGGQTYHLVAKISQQGGEYERIDLFIDPASTVEPVTPDATAINTGVNLTNLSLFNIRTANLESGDVIRFDEIRIASTFAEAVGVPEPATLAMMGFAALSVLRRRQRAL